MKRIICLILATVVLLLSVGCNNQSDPTEPPQTEQPTEEKQTEPKVYDNSPYSGGMKNGWMDWGYNEFEAFLPRVSDIVKATFVGTVKKDANYLYDFEVKSVIKGTCQKELITVFVQPLEYDFGWYTGKIPTTHFETYEIDYLVGKDYLLLLSRKQIAYLDEDLLTPIENSLVIPLDESGNIKSEDCKLYDTDLALHLKDSETATALQNGTFIDKVLELTKDNSDVYYDSISKETDPAAVLSEAECVMTIKVGKKLNNFDYPYYVGEYYFEVVENFKGNYDETTIDLPAEKVEAGKVYTVALNEKGKLSGRNSIFSHPIE